MNLHKPLAYDLPANECLCAIDPALQGPYTSLSINHLVQEGIRWYSLKNKKSATFELNLCPNLNQIGGEPNQLRRVFLQLIDCIVDATQSEKPHLKFTTQNVSISSENSDLNEQHQCPSSGTHVLLQIEIDNLCLLPHFEVASDTQSRPFCRVAQTHETEIEQRTHSKAFVWSQVCEVIMVHGGLVVGTAKQADTAPNQCYTTVDVILPTLHKKPSKVTATTNPQIMNMPVLLGYPMLRQSLNATAS